MQISYIVYLACMVLIFVVIVAAIAASVSEYSKRSKISKAYVRLEAERTTLNRAIALLDASAHAGRVWRQKYRADSAVDLSHGEKIVAQQQFAMGYHAAFDEIVRDNVNEREFWDYCQSVQDKLMQWQPDEQMAHTCGSREFIKDWLYALQGNEGLVEFRNMFGEVA